jgi:hypothetical protein
LEPTVDQQPPKVVGADVLGVVDRDAITDHHETDGLVVGVDRPIPGLRIGMLRGLGQGLRDAGDVVALLLGDNECLDGGAVVVGDLP